MLKKINPLYFALDFQTGDEAVEFLKNHQLHQIPVKVGMELFYSEGPEIIHRLKYLGHPIFLDLKLHDIPATVERSMANLSRLEVDVVNIHAQGGGDMIKAARSGLDLGNPHKRPLLLAVTQLTSSDQSMLEKELLVERQLTEVVVHYSKLSKQSGADGVVSSVHEVERIKEAVGDPFITLTPGIRVSDSDVHDQKRVSTPSEARTRGSNSIVVGRSIKNSKNPKLTYQKIKEEFENGQPFTRA